MSDDAYTELTDCVVLATAAMSPVEPCYARQNYGDFTRWVGQVALANDDRESQMEFLVRVFNNQPYPPSYMPIVRWSTKMWLPQGMLTSNDYYEDYKALGATMMRAEDGVIKDRTKGEWLYIGFGGHRSSHNRAAHRYYTSWCGCVFTPSCWYNQWYKPEE